MPIEDLTTWTLNNPDTVLTVTSTQVSCASMNGFSSNPDQISKDRGAGFYSGDFTHRAGPINISAVSSNNSRFVILGVGLTTIDPTNACEGTLIAGWLNTTTNPTLYLAEYNTTNTGTVPDSGTTSATYQNAAVGLSTNFWLELSRTGTTAKLKVYSDAYSTLLQTLSFTLSQTLSYEFVFACGKAMGGTGATISASVQNVDLAPGGGGDVFFGQACL